MNEKLYHICYDCLDKPHVADYKDIEVCEICGYSRSGVKVAKETFELVKNNIINETLKRR